MATYFCVADVHSFYDEMIEALEQSGFDINNDSHIFVSLGDLLDRGPKPEECLRFVNSLPEHRKILIKGNHEYLMMRCIRDKNFAWNDYHNKTVETVMKLTDSVTLLRPFEMLTKMEHNELWKTYIDSCIDYYETPKYVFVHGWIPCVQYIEDMNRDGDQISNYDLLPDWHAGNWERASWLNGMECWKYNIKIPDKTILCGHYHSSWGHCYLHGEGIDIPKDEMDLNNWITEPFVDDGIVALDACTALSGKINCWKLTKQKALTKIKYEEQEEIKPIVIEQIEDNIESEESQNNQEEIVNNNDVIIDITSQEIENDQNIQEE